MKSEVHSKEHAPSQIIGVEFGQIHGRILEAALRIDHAEGTLLFARTSLVGERLEADRAGDAWKVTAIHTASTVARARSSGQIASFVLRPLWRFNATPTPASATSISMMVPGSGTVLTCTHSPVNRSHVLLRRSEVT